jgi:hypothetical protein
MAISILIKRKTGKIICVHGKSRQVGEVFKRLSPDVSSSAGFPAKRVKRTQRLKRQ